MTDVEVKFNITICHIFLITKEIGINYAIFAILLVFTYILKRNKVLCISADVIYRYLNKEN